MAETSKIEWTDATWNPITGCSVVSPGCTNCYAMRLAGTRLQHHPSRAGLTTPTRSGPVWTGDVRFNEHWIEQPLRWRRPRNIFVCAHGDLFHPNVQHWMIDRVFAVMDIAHWHIFQVLTKRPERMRAYLSSRETLARISLAVDDMVGPEDVIETCEQLPLPNVWLGTSVEDQRRADERIPHLLATPATVRFLSVEPMLGKIDLEGYLPDLDCGDGIDWVICGGESGPNARDMDPEWARSLRDQCARARVPFFHKQMARKAPIPADLLVRQWPEVTHA